MVNSFVNFIEYSLSLAFILIFILWLQNYNLFEDNLTDSSIQFFLCRHHTNQIYTENNVAHNSVHLFKFWITA